MMLVLFTVLYIPIVIIVGSIINGHVISILWRWFIVSIEIPISLGNTSAMIIMPELSIAHAIGISIFVGVFTYNSTKSDDNNDSTSKKFIELTVKIFLPYLSLLFGWIVKGFM